MIKNLQGLADAATKELQRLQGIDAPVQLRVMQDGLIDGQYNFSVEEHILEDKLVGKPYWAFLEGIEVDGHVDVGSLAGALSALVHRYKSYGREMI